MPSIMSAGWTIFGVVLVCVVIIFIFGGYFADRGPFTVVPVKSTALIRGVKGRCLPPEKHRLIKLSINESLSKIWTDWDVSNYPQFLRFMNIPPLSWELHKHKFLSILLDPSPTREYVAGFSGSSVTAGHDNYFNESFPEVFRSNLAKIFDLADIKLIVRNQALGNNPCYPYDACMATHMGDGVDLLAWEQSMNCGRTARPLETFVRSAMRMKKSPAVLFIASGTPFWKAEECVNTSRTPLLEANGMQILSKSAKQNAAESGFMNEFRYLRSNLGSMLHEVYTGASPMGQTVMAAQTYKCRGPYSPHFGEKTPGNGAGWHPGRLGHKLRGDSLAYFLLKIFEDALDEVSSSCVFSTTHSQNGSMFHSPVADQMLASTLTFLQQNIDKRPLSAPPVACFPEECSSDAACFTDYLPRASNNTLSSQIVESMSHLSWNATSALVNVTPSPSTVSLSNWTLELSFFDVKAVQKSEERGMGYMDRKYIFVSQGTGTHISFRVIITAHKSSIWICECQKGFLQYPANMVDLDKGSIVLLHSYPYQDGAAGSQLRLSLLQDQCYKTNPVASGDYIITVIQNSTSQINIGYLLYW